MGEAKRRKQLDPKGFGKISFLINERKTILETTALDKYFTDPELINWIEETLPESSRVYLPKRKILTYLDGIKTAIIKHRNPKKLYAVSNPKISIAPVMGIRLTRGRLWLNSNYPQIPLDGCLGNWVEFENSVPLWHKSIYD